jgi:DNA-binding MarR family transcriptional regulator
MVTVAYSTVAYSTNKNGGFPMIMRSLTEIAKYWGFYVRRELRRTEIVGSEHSVMMYLSLDDGASQDTISRHLVLDKGTIAKALARLEQKGLVRRTANPRNRRENIVSLTDRGLEEVRGVHAVAEDWEASILDGLSDIECKQLERLLGQVARQARSMAGFDRETQA